jgi:vacuolar protein sorting-associated protein 52
MWLDRLASQAHTSGSSTPQPASRPYSPLPRRTSSSLGPYVTSQRSGNTPRGSSVSLISNDSNTSLLSQSRKANNASGLRQSTTVFNGQDPADVLEKLLSSDVDDARSSQTLISEEDLKLRPDFGGLSLKELAESDTELDEATQRASLRPSNAQDCACSSYTCRNRSVG